MDIIIEIEKDINALYKKELEETTKVYNALDKEISLKNALIRLQQSLFKDEVISYDESEAYKLFKPIQDDYNFCKSQINVFKTYLENKEKQMKKNDEKLSIIESKLKETEEQIPLCSKRIDAFESFLKSTEELKKKSKNFIEIVFGESHKEKIEYEKLIVKKKYLTIEKEKCIKENVDIVNRCDTLRRNIKYNEEKIKKMKDDVETMIADKKELQEKLEEICIKLSVEQIKL